MKTVKVKCKYCNGIGDVSFPEATSVDTESDGYYPCSWCGGSGTVEEAELPVPEPKTVEGTVTPAKSDT